MAQWGVLFPDYVARWRAATAALPPEVQLYAYGAVVEGGREYPLLALRLPGPSPLVITAGFHGDEKAGPLTLVEHVAEIAAEAIGRGIGLRIYPCINPSGFEAHTRYNLSGERPNNDFLRYELEPGRWRGELRAGESYLQIAPARDGVPKETAALARELERDPAPAAALDLHQDNFMHGALFYAYVFGDLAAYRPLVARCGSLVSVVRSSIVDSGHEPGSNVYADAEGFILCTDGSITDRFYRAGVPYTAAVETTTETPEPIADAINLIWIRGFLALAAQSAAGG